MIEDTFQLVPLKKWCWHKFLCVGYWVRRDPDTGVRIRGIISRCKKCHGERHFTMEEWEDLPRRRKVKSS